MLGSWKGTRKPQTLCSFDLVTAPICGNQRIWSTSLGVPVISGVSSGAPYFGKLPNVGTLKDLRIHEDSERIMRAPAVDHAGDL